MLVKWHKSPWVISLGTALFSLLGTIIYDYFKSKPFLTTIWSIFKVIWWLIIRVLNYNIKVWWLLLTLGLFTAAIYLVFRFSKDEPSPPDFCNYKEGVFKKWKWTWGWRWQYSKNAWVISNLTAHCPKCDTPMHHYSSLYSQSFECPRCDYRPRDSECEEPSKIESIIIDNLNRNLRNKSI